MSKIKEILNKVTFGILDFVAYLVTAICFGITGIVSGVIIYYLLSSLTDIFD